MYKLTTTFCVFFAGDALLEYVQLALNQECYLVGLSGVPDFKLTLWDWTKAQMIHSVPTALADASAATLAFSSDIGTGPSKLLLLQAGAVGPGGGISVWKVKRCGREARITHETKSNKEVIRSMSEAVTATWHHPNVLYIIDTDGHLIRVSIEVPFCISYAQCTCK